MPLCISKECFPAPIKCHNCERKKSSDVKKETDAKEDFKRCSNCHMMTYCDKDCQREHWTKVHKSHCRFLSGKVHPKNSKHNAATCSRCIEQNQASPSQLMSENSPKTTCNLEVVTNGMKTFLSQMFSFHGEGKNCNCSLKFACELPFPLGEVSGQYLENGGTLLDAMLAHSLKIINAMVIKAKKEETKNALLQLWKKILNERSILWYDVLVSGMPNARCKSYLSDDHVNSLKTVYGASNPWWKTLFFSVNIVFLTIRSLRSNFRDSRSLEDPRFPNLKLLQDYRQSQLQNQAIMCEKKLWPKFMLWPGLANGSLSLLLPPGIRCQNCNAKLCGEVSISSDEVNYQTRPSLIPGVGESGDLMTCCPVAKNPGCLEKIRSKNVEVLMCITSSNEELEKEINLFYIESRDCDQCFKSSLSSHRCSACLAVQYCSTVCQKKDLEFHKSVCATWANDKSRKILGKGKQVDHWKSVLGGQ